MHHWRYAYAIWQVIKNPQLALEHTNEFCYRCHKHADCLRRLYEDAKRHPQIIRKIFELARKSIDDFDETMEAVM